MDGFPTGAMLSTRLHATRQRRSGVRGYLGYPGRRGSTVSGYGSSIPRHLKDMLDGLEEQMAVHQLAGQRAQTHHKHY